MSVLKLPWLFASALGFHVSLRRPSAPNEEDKVIALTTRERAWGRVGPACERFLQIAIWLAALAESMVIVSSSEHFRHSETTAAILDALGPPEASELTVPFVLGALLVSMGGMIRLWCYRTLGRQFTFQLCLRKDHQLVTSGPYSIVRHPGYTCIYMCVLGVYAMHGVPGSWLRESGVLNVGWVRGVVVGWCVIIGAAGVTLVRRTTDEDRFLKETFGREWEGWARRVRYKLVPFVY